MNLYIIPLPKNDIVLSHHPLNLLFGQKKRPEVQKPNDVWFIKSPSLPTRLIIGQ